MENINTDNRFYNYVLLDPRKPGDYNYGDLHFDFEPFYVGKGNGDRCKAHIRLYGENKFKDNKIKKILSLGLNLISLKIYENLSEKESFDNELNLINIIGRSNLKLGPLTNLTNGGEGVSGAVYSPEIKLKKSLAVSLANRDRKWTDEAKLKVAESNKGRKHTDETRLKISKANKGKKRTDECNKKQSLSRIGKKINISDDGRKRISETHKGNTHSLGKKASDATKLKLSKAGKGRKHTDETKLKISKANKGKKRTDEFKQKTSELKIGNKCSLGRKWTDESKLKVSIANKGRKQTKEMIEKRILKRCKPVIQLDKNNVIINEFKSIKEASEKIGISGIGRVCRNLQKTAGGSKWKFK